MTEIVEVFHMADDLPPDLSMVVHIDPQIRRIRRAIAEIDARPAAARRAVQVLRDGLQAELEAIRFYRSHADV